ncbi:MAG: hypothetical protein HPY76_13745, partial [Anaerolineae bacterium]|nr:hypothetical protein [Anaerolineae bacterium]
MNDQLLERAAPRSKKNRTWLWVVLLIYILLVGAYFRFVGLNWDETYHLHPDERFLTMVETGLEPVDSLKDYFDTSTSSLNPNNRGYGFYVYGTLPIFIVRYVAEWTSRVGYDQVHLVGRFISASFDLMTVLLVFLIADRLFRNKVLALLAAAFSAASVLPIQLAHYFTVDSYTNFFVFLAFYFAVHFMTLSQQFSDSDQEEGASGVRAWMQVIRQNTQSLAPAALFGLALGMAMASKISAAPLAMLLPAAALIRYLQLPQSEKQTAAIVFVRDVVLAAFIAFITFRIFQPYAFTGPGFLGIGLNEQWLNNLRELAAQSGGDVDFPPALQWARRPLWFALYNMVTWGLGLPLGLLAWGAFIWMGIKIFRGAWQQHILIWGWTAFYFTWQSLNFTRSMRYQMAVYPTLAIIAAWGILALWNSAPRAKIKHRLLSKPVVRGVTVFIAALVVLGTFAWAFAFTRIYTRPVTRVDASRWIYENVPGAINLEYELDDGSLANQPLAFRLQSTVTSQQPLLVAFVAQSNGTLREMNFSHVLNATPNGSGEVFAVQATLLPQSDSQDVLARGLIVGQFPPASDPRGDQYRLIFDQPYSLEAGQRYWLRVAPVESYVQINLSGPLNIAIDRDGDVVYQSLPEPANAIRQGMNYMVNFQPRQDGTLTGLDFPLVVDWEADPSVKILSATITSGDLTDVLTEGKVSADFIAGDDPRGSQYAIDLDPPLAVKAGENYLLKLEILSGGGSVALYSKRQVIESTWDDPLPLPMAGYNPFDYVMGLYRSDLNFEMYWDDNKEKLARFETVLDQADYIFMSSNRQWGTTVRVPERYPLTSAYYRNLLGCPPDKDIVWCYRVAEPGMFEGALGFELVQVFTSYPNLGELEFNTQFAEEAFTVYDHPKVLIFQKTDDYSPQNVREILRAVDLSQVIHLTPRKASTFPGNLMLPLQRLTVQRAGGTWSDLFDWDALQNRYPLLGLLLWYLVVSLMGWLFYPIMRLAMPGLADRGFPAVRMGVMLVMAYLSWLAGSAGIPVTRISITVIAVIIAALGLVLLRLQRVQLAAEWRE